MGHTMLKVIPDDPACHTKPFATECPALNLPIELWLEVIKHNWNPREVMSLSQVRPMYLLTHIQPNKSSCPSIQTCLALHRRLSHRSVWAATLRAVCENHDVSMTSFPLAAMDLHHLQRAAFGPSLWAKSLEYAWKDVKPMQAISKVVLLVRAAPAGECSHYLVPGGKFLITADYRSMKLWDLGTAGIAPLQDATLLAAADLETSWDRSFPPPLGVRVDDCNVLRVIVDTGSRNKRQVSITDYDSLQGLKLN